MFENDATLINKVAIRSTLQLDVIQRATRMDPLKEASNLMNPKNWVRETVYSIAFGRDKKIIVDVIRYTKIEGLYCQVWTDTTGEKEFKFSKTHFGEFTVSPRE